MLNRRFIFQYVTDPICYLYATATRNVMPDLSVYMLLWEIFDERGDRIGFNYTTIPCADCTLEGGTTTKPPYWP